MFSYIFSLLVFLLFKTLYSDPLSISLLDVYTYKCGCICIYICEYLYISTHMVLRAWWYCPPHPPSCLCSPPILLLLNFFFFNYFYNSILSICLTVTGLTLNTASKKEKKSIVPQKYTQIFLNNNQISKLSIFLT